jgi:predicted aconitase with swiveling domain
MDVADNEAYRMKMHRPMECEVMCLPRSKGGATGSMVVTLVVAMLSSEECLGSYYNE